jgi:hypothetical protein
VKNSMISRRFGLWLFPLFLVGVVAFFPLAGYSAATIVIVNGDGLGEGLNDPTPVAPVGGNSGTTLGAQRLIALQHAAGIWGSNLTSSVPITILASFDPLSCTVTAATLGSAVPWDIECDFTGAIYPNTWYPVALANKLHGSDLTPGAAHIRAWFNSNLGQPGCLTGTHFYLGLDNNHGSDIDLVTQALHDFARGLGFMTTTSLTSGALLMGFPSVYDHFVLDLTTNKTWPAMTDAERKASAINARKVVWTGANVTANVPSVLAAGIPELQISSPSSIAGAYMVGTASFGPPLTSPGVTGELMPIVGLACDLLSGANALAASGKIVLIDRGTCGFVVKVKNAQNAGAIGVIIGDNVAGSPPAGLGGTDPTIVIPSVRVTQADANTLKNALKYRSRTHSGVFANLGVNIAVRPGADALNRMLLYTPNPIQFGVSVNSWDTSAFPSLLMEPSINSDLTHSVDVPQDLTLPLLKDIGW